MGAFKSSLMRPSVKSVESVAKTLLNKPKILGREVREVWKDCPQSRIGHSEPASQRRGVLIERCRRNPVAAISGVIRSGQVMCRESAISRGTADGSTDDQMMTAPP